MFENIIGQETVINLLKNDIEKGTLSNSMIFHGVRCSGKLTAALELTRAINCMEDGEYGCRCDNCRRVYSLDFAGLIFLSRRNFSFQLKEYITAYREERKALYRNGIFSAVKLSLIPLQEFLIKNCYTESEKKGIFEQASRAAEIINQKEYSDVDLEELEKIVDKINSLYKNQNIPVDSIREMLNWSYISHQGIKRVVIIDQIDMLEESSRNILLKRLEEPAPNLYFILLAENRNRILKTILSRCRSYYFSSLTEESVSTILGSYYGETARYESVSDFLMRSDGTSRKNIYPLVSKLLNLTFLKNHNFGELSLFLKGLTDRKIVTALLIECSRVLEEEILTRESGKLVEAEIEGVRKISFINLKYIRELLDEKVAKIKAYNLNPLYQLEGIFYPMKAEVLNDNI